LSGKEVRFLDNFKFLDGKKYGWDGQEYMDDSAARVKMSEYSNNGFMTKLIEVGGKHFIFTRRVVTEIVVEGGSS
jgi:hypothetical protein